MWVVFQKKPPHKQEQNKEPVSSPLQQNTPGVHRGREESIALPAFHETALYFHCWLAALIFVSVLLCVHIYCPGAGNVWLMLGCVFMSASMRNDSSIEKFQLEKSSMATAHLCVTSLLHKHIKSHKRSHAHTETSLAFDIDIKPASALKLFDSCRYHPAAARSWSSVWLDHWKSGHFWSYSIFRKNTSLFFLLCFQCSLCLHETI